MERVKLVSATHFELTDEELKQMYTLMALYNYRYDRKPEYNQEQILRHFRGKIEEFNSEIIRLKESDPNNLTLHRIHQFFKLHCGDIRKITKQKR